MPEPGAVKVACPVLWGGWASNGLSLPAKLQLLIMLGGPGARYIENMARKACGISANDWLPPTGSFPMDGRDIKYILSGYTSWQMERYSRLRLTVDVQNALAEIFLPENGK